MDHTVFNPESTLTGIRFGRRMIGYSVAIRSLDSGRYDRNLAKGMEILACIMEAVESGWLELNVEKQIIVWRWLLAAVFIVEEQEKNGTIEIANENGGVDRAIIYSGKNGAMSIYPGPLRFSLANHVEGIAIQKYGQEVGQQLALRTYQEMIVSDPEHGFKVSTVGREGLELLHDDYIKMINTGGIPEMPVTH